MGTRDAVVGFGAARATVAAALVAAALWVRLVTGAASPGTSCYEGAATLWLFGEFANAVCCVLCVLGLALSVVCLALCLASAQWPSECKRWAYYWVQGALLLLSAVHAAMSGLLAVVMHTTGSPQQYCDTGEAEQWSLDASVSLATSSIGLSVLALAGSIAHFVALPGRRGGYSVLTVN
eukprot:m51a1_g6106 hypothetical protein (179) ;mRNA; f:82753-83385